MAIPTLPTVHPRDKAHRFWCRPRWRGWLRINQLRFSQSSIGASLQDGRPLTRVEDDLRTGRLWASELGPLNVVYFRGRWFSRDNRRLHVLQKVLRPDQHVRVRFGYVNSLFLSHFSTEDEGDTIRVRLAKNAGRRSPRPPPPSDLGTAPAGAPPRRTTCQRILCKANLEARLVAYGNRQTICQTLLHSTSGDGRRPPRAASTLVLQLLLHSSSQHWLSPARRLFYLGRALSPAPCPTGASGRDAAGPSLTAETWEAYRSTDTWKVAGMPDLHVGTTTKG